MSGSKKSVGRVGAKDENALLTQAQYEHNAWRILASFEGVIDEAETRLVLAARLRSAVEKFITNRGGSQWLDLLHLMCAYQSIGTARVRREAEAAVTDEQPVKP